MSAGAENPWASKLADAELRQLSGPQTASVIVELDLPRPRVEMERSEAGGIGASRPRRIETESAGEERRCEAVITQARSFLEQLLGTPPVWLSAARAFGVEASGDQLRVMTRSPLVRRVYLSRVRR
ncbi:MAG: hypothetical protein M3131_09825 [Actinomycetota bacterium]|nr:hypothetical protein [Actinomycetota bacterium]